MVYEPVDHGFLLPVREPENVSGFHVNDGRRVFVTVMELELVDPKELRPTFRLNEPLAVDGILLLQPLLICSAVVAVL